MFNRLLDPEGSKLPRLSELGPQIGNEVARLQALTESQLAAEVMTKAFTADYSPAEDMREIGGVTDAFVPDYGPPRAGDSTPDELLMLQDLLAEGVQVLEHARLVRPKFGYSGNIACNGWVTTRRGRSALSGGSLESELAQSLRG